MQCSNSSVIAPEGPILALSEPLICGVQDQAKTVPQNTPKSQSQRACRSWLRTEIHEPFLGMKTAVMGHSGAAPNPSKPFQSHTAMLGRVRAAGVRPGEHRGTEPAASPARSCRCQRSPPAPWAFLTAGCFYVLLNHGTNDGKSWRNQKLNQKLLPRPSETLTSSQRSQRKLPIKYSGKYELGGDDTRPRAHLWRHISGPTAGSSQEHELTVPWGC